MSTKIFRDPLYNYISIDRRRDGWLIDLLDTAEMQRLRRIQQLGVSLLTYTGAGHNRLAHSLGVLHLMQMAMHRVAEIAPASEVETARHAMLAAALVHDVGHGPFSHLFEPCLGTQHEAWSQAIVQAPATGVHQVLARESAALPATVAELIDPGNHDHPAWMKYLLSSQLDMDRLDYLRRDSLFTGAGFGHYDWFRILTTFELYGDTPFERDVVWGERTLLAIEEYIFARHYMYQNVYLHKTTRGFEKMIEALWARAKELRTSGVDVDLLPALERFWTAPQPAPHEYLAIEEFTVLQQIQNWTAHRDPSLSDLARRFLARDRFVMIEPPRFEHPLAPGLAAWDAALQQLVAAAGFDPPEMYCLADAVKGKYHQPYFPEKEADEQSAQNAIRVQIDGKPIEVSILLDRLKLFTQEPVDRVRHYVPQSVRAAALALRARWNG